MKQHDLFCLYGSKSIPDISLDKWYKMLALSWPNSIHKLTLDGTLERFAGDTPPALVPIYTVYLYHAWLRTASAVRSADLIVVVHQCIKHDGTDALNAVVDGTALEDRVRYADGKGQSSVIRAVCRYFG